MYFMDSQNKIPEQTKETTQKNKQILYDPTNNVRDKKFEEKVKKIQKIREDNFSSHHIDSGGQ